MNRSRLWPLLSSSWSSSMSSASMIIVLRIHRSTDPPCLCRHYMQCKMPCWSGICNYEKWFQRMPTLQSCTSCISWNMVFYPGNGLCFRISCIQIHSPISHQPGIQDIFHYWWIIPEDVPDLVHSWRSFSVSISLRDKGRIIKVIIKRFRWYHCDLIRLVYIFAPAFIYVDVYIYEK